MTVGDFLYGLKHIAIFGNDPDDATSSRLSFSFKSRTFRAVQGTRFQRRGAWIQCRLLRPARDCVRSFTPAQNPSCHSLKKDALHGLIEPTKSVRIWFILPRRRLRMRLPDTRNSLVPDQSALRSTCRFRYLPQCAIAYIALLPEGQYLGSQRFSRRIKHEKYRSTFGSRSVF
jgi:hypothetical protein